MEVSYTDRNGIFTCTCKYGQNRENLFTCTSSSSRSSRKRPRSYEDEGEVEVVAIYEEY